MNDETRQMILDLLRDEIRINVEKIGEKDFQIGLFLETDQSNAWRENGNAPPPYFAAKVIRIFDDHFYITDVNADAFVRDLLGKSFR